jgi:hypothetical protein
MIRSTNLILFLAIVLPANTQFLPSNAEAATAQNPVSAATSPEEAPDDAIPQNAPCVGQPKSLRELAASFARGQVPLASQITGTWVQIGDIYKDPAVKNSLNCLGVRRGNTLEFVLIADGYAVALHAIGTYPQKAVMRPDHKGSVEFSVDFGADEGPETYRCRLTKRGTLACVGPDTGEEFKKMKVDAGLTYRGSADN